MLSMIIQYIIHLYYLNIIIFFNIEQIQIVIVKLILIIYYLFLKFFHFFFLLTNENLIFSLKFFLVIIKHILKLLKMLIHLILSNLLVLLQYRLKLKLCLLKLIFSVGNQNLCRFNFMLNINHNLWNNLDLINLVLIQINALCT